MTTSNISVGGFYGLCAEAFPCGEQLECLVEIPNNLQSFQSPVTLECSVRVVRVDPLFVDARERFGVAFRIEDYRLTERNQRVFGGDEANN
jgi:hypothetical protein